MKLDIRSRSNKHAASIDKQQSIVDRQARLDSKINSFNERIETFLGSFQWECNEDQIECQEEVDDFDFSDQSSALGEADCDLEDLENVDEDCACAESPKPWIPSLFGWDVCLKNGLQQMADQEIQLRIGQANDSLGKLRMALGQKTSLFVNVVRKAKHSQARTSQARTLVNQANFAVEKHAGSYRRARAALLKLGAREEILQKFKPLTKEDLKVCTDLVKETIVGQRNDKVAWFWRLDGSGDPQGDNWLKEGQPFFYF